MTRNIYCGNNLLNVNVTNGTKRMGTRYECFKKGIGAGFHKELDQTTIQNYNQYESADPTKIYCGTKQGARIPPGYTRLGTPTECLRKGFGVGVRQQIEQQPPLPREQPNNLEQIVNLLETIIIDLRAIL